MKKASPGRRAVNWYAISGEGTRTLDTADMSRMLYHLSYAAMTKKDERQYSSRVFHCQPRSAKAGRLDRAWDDK